MQLNICYPPSSKKTLNRTTNNSKNLGKKFLKHDLDKLKSKVTETLSIQQTTSHRQ